MLRVWRGSELAECQQLRRQQTTWAGPCLAGRSPRRGLPCTLRHLLYVALRPAIYVACRRAVLPKNADERCLREELGTGR